MSLMMQRWSLLNKKTVKLYSVDFADLATDITNDTLVFEWGDKILYTEWIKDKRAGLTSSVTTFESNLFHSWLWRRKLQSLIFSFRVALGAQMAQSVLWPDYGLELPKNQRFISPDDAKDWSFPKFSDQLWGPVHPQEGNGTPSVGYRAVKLSTYRLVVRRVRTSRDTPQPPFALRDTLWWDFDKRLCLCSQTVWIVTKCQWQSR